MGIQCKKVRQNVNYNNVCDAKWLPPPPSPPNDEAMPAGNHTETDRFRCQHVVGEQRLRSLRSSQPTPSPMPQPRSLATTPSAPTTKPATKCVQREPAKLHLVQQQQQRQRQQSHENQCDRRGHCNDIERKLRSKKALSSSLKITIANKIIARFTQLISFNQDHKSSASPYTNAVTIAPTNKTNTNTNNNNDNDYLDRIESANTNDRNNSTKHKYNNNNNNVNNNPHSQYFIRQSLSLYAASGFLLALCYLVIPAAALIDTPHPM